MIDIYGEKAEKIVDAVLVLCEEINDGITGEDLMNLFSVAIKGGREYAAIKMTMVAHALGKLGDEQEARK